MTLQRRLLAKLRLHPGAMAGRAFPPHACWWPSRSVWMVDGRSQDDLPIRLATRQEIVPYTVAPMFYSILSEAILSFASLKR